MSRDVVFETIGRGHRPLVERAVRRGDRVFVFDFTYRLRSMPWLRDLINADRVVRIYVPPCTREEGGAFDATEAAYPAFARHPIVRALARLYGAAEVEPIVKKALLDHVFEHLFMRAWLVAHLAGKGRGRRVTLVAPGFPAWERRLAGWPERPTARLHGLRVARWTSRWAATTRRLEHMARTAKASALAWLVLAARVRRRGTVAEPAEVEYVYAIDQPFQAKFRGARRFDFLLDGDALHAKNTAFVVHPSAEGPWMDEALREGFTVLSRRRLLGTRALLRTPPRLRDTRGLGRILRAVASRPTAPAWLAECALTAVHMHLAVARLGEAVRFANYVYTNQDGLDQRWQNVMLRRLGARTWNYVLSIGAGHLNAGGGDLRDIRDPIGRHRLHAFQNPDHFVMPGRDLVDYHRAHHQAVGAYHAIGNIHSELLRSVPAAESRALRAEWFGAATAGRKVVVWFDTSFVEEPLSPARFDEAVAWYDDIAGLADQRPDLLMVLKPSKAEWYFTDPGFQWSHPRGTAVVERWERLRSHPRVHFAGHEADPASVMAAADLTVTFCYSSPTAEALGARRRALWYEPFARWRGTLYDRDPRLVAHGYDELVRAVRWALDDASVEDYDRFLEGTVRGLVEDFLDARGLTRFRALLAGDGRHVVGMSETPRHVVGAAARYSTATAVSMALPFATLPIMTRWLTPADYGIVALGQVVASLFMGLASLGLTAGLDRGFFKYETDPQALARLMHSGLVTITLMTAALGIVLFVTSAPLAAWLYGDPMWAPLLLVMALTSSLGVVVTACLSYLRNRERASAFMRWSVASLLFESALVVALVAGTGLGPWGLVLGALAGKVIVAAAMWVSLARELPPAFDAAMVREMLGIGVPLLPRTCLGVADNGLDRLLVNWLSSLGQVGLFGMANRVGYSVFSLMTSLEQVFLPPVYRSMFSGGADTAARLGAYLSPYFVVSVAVPALVALFVEELLWVLVTPLFYGVAPIAAVLAGYYGQMFFGKIVGAQLVYAKKTWYSSPLAAVRLAVHLVAALLLIEPFGALGAALALLATGLVADALGVVAGQRAFRISYELRIVVPGMLCLYCAVLWALAGPWLGLPYAARLGGKAVIVASLVLLAGRWLKPAQLRGLIRAPRAAVSV